MERKSVELASLDSNGNIPTTQRGCLYTALPPRDADFSPSRGGAERRGPSYICPLQSRIVQDDRYVVSGWSNCMVLAVFGSSMFNLYSANTY